MRNLIWTLNLKIVSLGIVSKHFCEELGLMLLDCAECDQGLLVFAQKNILYVMGSADFRVGHRLAPLIETVGEKHLQVLLAPNKELPKLFLVFLVDCCFARRHVSLCSY